MTGQAGKAINQELLIQDNKVDITSLLMGVPHTIVFVDDVDKADVAGVGSKIEKHHYFPEGTNVNFVEIINKNEINIRTWERGAGCTLACGTGSCASVVASVLNKKTDNIVTVHLELGDLLIEWKDNTVFMTGPASNVFSGEIEI
jgi:diaminopimelate epimerase